MELLKLVFNEKTDTIDTYESQEYETDVRAIIISQSLEYDLDEVESIKQIKGKFKYYYKKTTVLQSIMVVGIILITLIQKPQWCYE